MLSKINKIHFVGIGGYGMSALAKVLLQNGYEITGSDITTSSLISTLENMGAKITLFHSKDNVGDAQLVVYSTAISGDNVEIKAAKESRIPVWHRSQLLAHLFNKKFGIAVAGAHGKTTTTSMISLILSECGLDPTALIGGELSHFSGNARVGKGKEIVAEACESDHSFLRYESCIAVITNIEADHLEYYDGNFNKLLDTYKKFLKNLKLQGTAIFGADCLHMEDVLKGLDRKIITFGKSADADILIDDIKLYQGGSEFLLKKNNFSLGTICLHVPGEHNAQNAAAAVTVALELGLEFDEIKEALSKFEGAKRRFTIVGRVNDTVIVDDYAHHPTEIEATLKTAQNECGGDVIAVFQPHRYTRTKYLMNDFATAFEYADKVILNQVYAAGENPIKDINSRVLAEKIVEKRTNDDQEVIVIDELDEIIECLAETIKPGDYVITMGAGDIWKAAEGLNQKLNLTRKVEKNG